MSVSIHVLTSLKTALRAHVLAKPEVAALVGSAFHDMPQKTANPPYLAFGNAVLRDDSSQLSDAVSLDLEVIALAHERGTTRAMALAAAFEAALSEPIPPLEGHRLIALERPEARIQHDAEKNLVRASYRLRAYIEQL
ncbi:MAG: DUF3168 domain-containing protein [Proteobacteria bacterium]|nr:DUF3168 domain-containing protein [Pseudomonadota bacterium]